MNLSDVAPQIANLTAQYPFAVHWEIRDVATGERIGSGQDQVLGSFSTRKVSVLLACLALVRQQRLALDDEFVIDAGLRDGVQAGIMRNLAPGIALSLRDHLAQMMITSDNICTQLVFTAIEQATGNGLQWVNDYCAQVGLRNTLHREVFPRSGQLAWHHAIDTMTVTTPADQAHLLELLAHGMTDDAAAARLGLTQQLCQLAVQLMSQLFTPQLGARVTQGKMAEKNGRGIRGLSQVGLLLDTKGRPVASVAVFAEGIPVQLLDDVPGRVRAIELFVDFGQVLEAHFLDGSPDPVVPRQIVAPDFWEQEFGELLYACENGRAVNADMAFPFAGIGKVFLAVTVAELAQRAPGLLDERVEITTDHRTRADSGTLRNLTGALVLRVDDAVRLITGSGDGAATLALLDHLTAADIDIVAHARDLFADLPDTTITGRDTERSAGDGLTGTTTASDALRLLRRIIDHQPRVLDWMTRVFEPAGLANALPGYGPHTIEHWTVSGWAKLDADWLANQGRTSVLILTGSDGHFGVVAHAPLGTQDVSAKFGSLGLSAVPCTRLI